MDFMNNFLLGMRGNHFKNEWGCRYVRCRGIPVASLPPYHHHKLPHYPPVATQTAKLHHAAPYQSRPHDGHSDAMAGHIYPVVRSINGVNPLDTCLLHGKQDGMNDRLKHVLKWEQDNIQTITKGKTLASSTGKPRSNDVIKAVRAMRHRAAKAIRNDLRDHVEAQLRGEMTWENYGILWEIDHVIPLATAGTVMDVLALSHYTNIRPRLVGLNRLHGLQYIRRPASRWLHLDSCAGD